MDRVDLSKTSISLLVSLRASPSDGAWGEFFGRYEPMIYAWCRARHLQEADALDVTQGVLTKLVERMSTFQYDRGRSFRGYLKTLTHFAVADALTSKARPGQGQGGSDGLRAIETIEAREELARQIEDQFDREVMQEAMSRITRRVEPRTWEAFRMLTFEDLPVREVADRLKMKVATVYVSKSKVLKMLREEVDQLERA